MIGMVERCRVQYIQLKNNLNGMESLIQEKKRDIGTRLKEDKDLLAKKCENIMV